MEVTPKPSPPGEKGDKEMANQIVSIRDIESDTWRLFRAQCVARGRTVAQEINRLLRQAVKEGE